MANVYPVRWGAQQIEALNFTDTIYSTGGVELILNGELTKGGEFAQAPYTNDILNYGDVTVMGESTTLSATALSSYSVQRASIFVANAMSETDFAKLKKGSEDLKVIATQTAAYSQVQNQKFIVSLLKGLFSTSGVLNSTHYIDNSGSQIGGDLIIDAKYDILGDKAKRVNYVYVHPKLMKKLEKYMTWENADKFGIPNASTVGTINGMPVIYNETLCASEDSGVTYPVYIIGANALFTEIGKNVTIEYGRNHLKLQDEVVVSWFGAFGAKGISWTGSAPTAKSDYETVGNYTKKWENSEIPIIKMTVGA